MINDRDLKSVFPPKVRYWELGWFKRLADKEMLFKKIILSFILAISALVALGLYFFLSLSMDLVKHDLIVYGLVHLLLLFVTLSVRFNIIPELLYLAFLLASFVLNFYFPVLRYYFLIPFLIIPIIAFFFRGIRQGMIVCAITFLVFLVMVFARFSGLETVNNDAYELNICIILSSIYIFETSMLYLREYVRRDERINMLSSRIYDETTGLPKRYLIEYAVGKDDFVFIAILSIKNLSHIGIIMGYDFLARVTVRIAGLLGEFRAKHNFDLYRLTKGEFGIVLEGQDPIELSTRAESIVRNIISEMRNLKITNNDLFIYTEIDIGTAMGKAGHISEILSKADQIKIDSHNLADNADRPFLMTSDIRERFIADQTKYDILLSNITGKKMEVHFQPVLDLATGKIFFYEALLRLRDADDNLVSVYEYLDVAQKTGIYSQLSFFVLDTIFDMVKNHKDVCFSFNLSINDIRNPAIIDFLSDNVDFLKKYNDRLIFEITETEVSEESKEMLSFLRFARDVNIRIAIDDFGTGYSNFTRLSDFPPYICKIDGQLFQKAYTDNMSAKVLEGIINLCKNLNVHTVAEYIETEEQKKFARLKKIDYGQGYLFRKPEPGL